MKKNTWLWVLWIAVILGAGFLSIAYFYNPNVSIPEGAAGAFIEPFATSTLPVIIPQTSWDVAQQKWCAENPSECKG